MTTEKSEMNVKDPTSGDITKEKTRNDIIDSQSMIVDIDGLDSKELEKKTMEKVRMIELYDVYMRDIRPVYDTKRGELSIWFYCDGVEVISPKIIDMICLHFYALKDFFYVKIDTYELEAMLLPTVVWRSGNCVLQFSFCYETSFGNRLSIWVRRYIDFDDKNSSVMRPVFWHMVARKSDDAASFYCNRLYAPYGVCTSDSEIGYYLVKNRITKVGCLSGKQFVSSDLKKVIERLRKGSYYSYSLPYYGKDSGQMIFNYDGWQRCSVMPDKQYIVDHIGMAYMVPMNIDLYVDMMKNRLKVFNWHEKRLFTDLNPNTGTLFACQRVASARSFKVCYFNRPKVDYFNGCSMKDVFTGNFDFTNADIILEGEKKNEVRR